MGCRCLWDSETDNFATAEFSNVRIESFSHVYVFFLLHKNKRTHTGNDFLHMYCVRRVPLLISFSSSVFARVMFGDVLIVQPIKIDFFFLCR